MEEENSPDPLELSPECLLHVRQYRPIDSDLIVAAVERGDVEEVVMLIRLGGDPNTGRKLTEWEVNEQWEDILDRVCDEFREVRIPDRESPAWTEEWQQKVDRIVDKFRWPVVCIASQRGDTNMVSALLKCGASPVARGGLALLTPLRLACRHDQTETADVLLKAGAGVNDFLSQEQFMRSDCMTHTLRQMLRQRRFEMTVRVPQPPELSLPSVFAKAGRSPLHDAIEAGSMPAFEWLLAHGADVNKQDPISQETPLHMAAVNDRLDMLERLLQAGADKEKGNSKGEAPLHRAVEAGYAEPARALLKHGADVNATAEDGRTALHVAARFNRAEFVAILADAGADMNARTHPRPPLLTQALQAHREREREREGERREAEAGEMPQGERANGEIAGADNQILHDLLDIIVPSFHVRMQRRTDPSLSRNLLMGRGNADTDRDDGEEGGSGMN